MKCVICGLQIPSERQEALEFLGIPLEEATCVSHGAQEKVKGVYFGKQGAGQLVITSALGKDGIERIEEARPLVLNS